jgi:hypothetical protein
MWCRVVWRGVLYPSSRPNSKLSEQQAGGSGGAECFTYTWELFCFSIICCHLYNSITFCNSLLSSLKISSPKLIQMFKKFSRYLHKIHTPSSLLGWYCLPRWLIFESHETHKHIVRSLNITAGGGSLKGNHSLCAQNEVMLRVVATEMTCFPVVL